MGRIPAPPTAKNAAHLAAIMRASDPDFTSPAPDWPANTPSSRELPAYFCYASERTFSRISHAHMENQYMNLECHYFYF
ncbi:hypothetical protein [Pandoraea capi]|uniref:hypothetical protein n=1 Tax=Pandoraea capi TaxID=2508286 RepID=UPI0012423CB5|nr:hypothetical protein [Pandoraea capi]